ncbi:MAG TPA: L-threonylcarbamoyladenylate synthase [Rhodoblastus sp.]|nr:L-threonylcarbamoyladenylate synthase [Rhodoblastus sp.]
MSSSHRTARILAPDATGVAEAARLIRAGGLVAFATETVYGLGADATSPKAVAKIYAAKGRPSFNPLIAHVTGLEAARREGRFSAVAERLAKAFWPGPLTLVLPLAEGASVCELARAGLASIALRAPDHALAQAMLAAVGRPVAAPSANRSGRVSPVTAAHVLEDLAESIDAVLDAGPTSVGLESTIVACIEGPPVLLRPGGVSRERIEALVGPLAAPVSGKVEAPGMLASHYAPRARLRLDATDLREGEAGLDFAGRFGHAAGAPVLDLSPRGDLVEAAGRLYFSLRELDASGCAAIAVAPIPAAGIGEAIRDRLSRAAAPRTDDGGGAEASRGRM